MRIAECGLWNEKIRDSKKQLDLNISFNPKSKIKNGVQ